MKCPHCLAVCLDTDPFCFSCRAPFSKNRHALPGGENGKPPYATRISMIFALLGACLVPIVCKGIELIPPSGGGLDLNQICWGGIGGAAGGTLGAAIGMILFGSGSKG